LSRKS